MRQHFLCRNNDGGNMKIIVQFVILLLTLNGYVLAEEVSTTTNSLGQVQKQAEAGDASAQTRLGWIYASGIGVLVDADKAVEWYQKAAAQGYPKAQYELGIMYGSGETVTSVAKDPNKAAEWFQKAAAQGYPKAQLELGKMHLTGEGVTKDATKAVEWYQKAAAQGIAQAQTSLGWMYQYGRGVTKDGVLAYAWHNLAAAQGNEDAKKLRDLTNLNSVQRAEAERLSANWKPGQVLSR